MLGNLVRARANRRPGVPPAARRPALRLKIAAGTALPAMVSTWRSP